MTDTFTFTDFKTENGLKTYLLSLVKKLLQEGNNLFIHNIQSKEYEGGEIISTDNRLRGIKKYGLHCKYSSIQDTLFPLQNMSAEQIVNTIIDYSYGHEERKDRINIVMAIPQYIDINGSKQNFSCLPTIKHEISNCYELVKGWDIDKEFLSFIIHPDPSDGVYNIEYNNLQFRELSPEHQKSFMTTYSDKIKQKCYISDTDNCEFVTSKVTSTIRFEASKLNTYVEGSIWNDFDFD